MNATVLPPGPLYILRGANSPVTSLHFTQTSLLSGTLDGMIHVWDLKTRRVTGSVDAHSGHHVLSIFSDPQSTNIVTMGRDGFLKIWQQSESSYEPTGSIPASMLGFCGASALPQCGSSSYVALPEQTMSDISVFDLASQKLVRNLAPSEQSKLGMCMCMSVVLDQSGIAVQLLAGYEDGSIILWDISTGKWLDKMTSHSDAVMCLAYSSTCNKGISGSVDEQLSAWSLSNSKLIATGNIEVMNPGFNCVVIRNDDKIAATGGWDGNVRVFGLKKLRPLAVLTHHKESVQSLAFSKDYLLAAGSKDHLITVWDIYRQM